jgi:hypothetical protein
VQLVCTYEGTRTRGGNVEAVISCEGVIVGADPEIRRWVVGEAFGQFIYDTKLGYVTSAQLTMIATYASPNDEPQVVMGADVKLTRAEGNPKKIEMVKVNLPNPKRETEPTKTAFKKPAESKMPTSYFKITSIPNSSGGAEKNYNIPGEQLKIDWSSGGESTLSLRSGDWYLKLMAPKGRVLKVGNYPRAQRLVQSAGVPGLTFAGKENGGDNKLVGEFVIWELEIKDNKVVRLALDFIQFPDGKSPPHKGSLRYNSTLE